MRATVHITFLGSQCGVGRAGMWSTVWLLWLLSAAGRSGHLHLPGNLDLDLEGREDTLSGTFDCNGRTYGYYGDPASNCQVNRLDKLKSL